MVVFKCKSGCFPVHCLAITKLPYPIYFCKNRNKGGVFFCPNHNTCGALLALEIGILISSEIREGVLSGRQAKYEKPLKLLKR